MNFLKGLGHVLLKVITFGAIAAKDVSPLVSLAFGPALGALVNGTATAIITAEATGQIALGDAPAGSNGAQKAALVISSIEPLAIQLAASLGAPAPTQEGLKAWTDGFVAAFNGLGIDLTKATAASPAA